MNNDTYNLPDRLKKFISIMFDKHPNRNDWYADTNASYGRVANGFIEEISRLESELAWFRFNHPDNAVKYDFMKNRILQLEAILATLSIDN